MKEYSLTLSCSATQFYRKLPYDNQKLIKVLYIWCCKSFARILYILNYTRAVWKMNSHSQNEHPFRIKWRWNILIIRWLEIQISFEPDWGNSDFFCPEVWPASAPFARKFCLSCLGNVRVQDFLCSHHTSRFFYPL